MDGSPLGNDEGTALGLLDGRDQRTDLQRKMKPLEDHSVCFTDDEVSVVVNFACNTVLAVVAGLCRCGWWCGHPSSVSSSANAKEKNV